MAEMDEEFSLAALADLDVSEIEEVRFVDLPAGVYEFEVVEGTMEEAEFDGVTVARIIIKTKIVEVKSCLDSKVDKDTLVGREHAQKFTVDPTKNQEEILKVIGRVRAFISDIGLDSKGKLGDIVANTKGHTFRAQIIKRKDRNDPSREFAQFKLDPKPRG